MELLLRANENERALSRGVTGTLLEVLKQSYFVLIDEQKSLKESIQNYCQILFFLSALIFKAFNFNLLSVNQPTVSEFTFIIILSTERE